MCEEPTFLDDETLTDNLDDDKANRVLNWLVLVHKNAPQDIDRAIYLAKEINSFYAQKEDEYKQGNLFKIESKNPCPLCGSEVNVPDIFERIMTHLEDRYADKKKK